MRPVFAKELYKHMYRNKDIWVVTGDLGFGMWDKIRDDFPDRFINTGAAETAMMDIGIGLTLEGKIPFVYSITPFLIYRPYEIIRTYINHEKIPVKMVGSGRDKDYHIDGFSHDASDIRKNLDKFEYIDQMWPETEEDIPEIVNQALACKFPDFISLKR